MIIKNYTGDRLNFGLAAELARAARPYAMLLIVSLVPALLLQNLRGFTEALRHAFHIHELGHAHWAAANENRYPVGLPPDVPDWRTLGAPKLARRDEP